MDIRYIINPSFSCGHRIAGRLGGDRRKIPIPIGDNSTCTQT